LSGATFSTFTFATTNIGSNLPVLKFAGWQAGTTAFTTLTFGQPGNGTAASGTWQTWVLSDDSMVFQSNASDGGFCIQSAPCTYGEFAARYPTGVWGQLQLGLGSGAPSGATGFADAASVTHVTSLYSYDFEVPAAQNSTASVQRGNASSTGGQAIVTMRASAVAAAPVTFTVVATLPDGSTESTEHVVSAGDTATTTVDVPFGTTSVSVTAQSVQVATGTVSFASETPGSPTPSATASSVPTLPSTAAAVPPAELAASGSTVPPLLIPLAALVAGAALLVIAEATPDARRRRRASHDATRSADNPF
jgi:hypothetical protein